MPDFLENLPSLWITIGIVLSVLVSIVRVVRKLFQGYMDEEADPTMAGEAMEGGDGTAAAGSPSRFPARKSSIPDDLPADLRHLAQQDPSKPLDKSLGNTLSNTLSDPSHRSALTKFPIKSATGVTGTVFKAPIMADNHNPEDYLKAYFQSEEAPLNLMQQAVVLKEVLEKKF